MVEPLNIGLIGTGHMGRAHTKRFAAPNRCHHDMAVSAIAAGTPISAKNRGPLSGVEAIAMRNAVTAAGGQRWCRFNNMMQPAVMLAR